MKGEFSEEDLVYLKELDFVPEDFIAEYLRKKGCECYEASVGPASSAWDRACELYAQLTGTWVDYGKVHSRQRGHKQFGRNYEKPMIENWSAENKIHLIGHSFGGTTIRMLAHLLTHGKQIYRGEWYQ